MSNRFYPIKLKDGSWAIYDSSACSHVPGTFGLSEAVANAACVYMEKKILQENFSLPKEFFDYMDSIILEEGQYINDDDFSL